MSKHHKQNPSLLATVTQVTGSNTTEGLSGFSLASKGGDCLEDPVTQDTEPGAFSFA